MVDKEERPQIIERGRQAVLIESVTGEFIASQEARLVTDLVRQYRGGTLSHDKMVGAVGGITALRDLVTELESEQRRATTAFQQEHDDAQGK